MASARREREAAAAEPDGTARPESWANPDPDAILALPDRKHPVTKVLANKHGRSSHPKEFRTRIRQCAEVLTAHPKASNGRMDWDQVMAYPWHHVDADAAADYARSMHAKYSNRGSRNVNMGVLRQIVKECYRSGLISAARKYEILDELPTRRPGASSKGRRLAQVEIAALMTYCDSNGDTGVRDAAIIAVFATTGMRISELVDLELTDWDRVDDTLLLRQPKNGRPHRVYVHPVTRARLLAWLQVRGDHPGALFTRLGDTDGAHVSTTFVRGWLARITTGADVAPFTSHDFRRTFASTMLRSHDPALVSKLLNHKSLEATLVYDLASADEMRAAVATVELPEFDVPDGGAE